VYYVVVAFKRKSFFMFGQSMALICRGVHLFGGNGQLEELRGL
jgi:hypothetical protein